MPGKAARVGAAQIAGYAVFAAMAAAVGALFYFGGFRYLLSNDSSSFTVELCLTESRVHRDAKVLVLGNSTAAEDFHPNLFNRLSPGNKALNLGVPSGHLYLFDRIVSASMKEGVHPRTVILMLTPDILSLRPDFDFLLNDLTLLKTVLNSSDFVTLASHSRTVRDYVNYASYVAARPVLYRGELRDFLGHPRERIKEAAVIRGWLASFHSTGPMTETNNSFSVCDAGPLAGLQQTVERLRNEGNASLAASYEQVWIGYAARVHRHLQVDAFQTLRLRRLLERITALGASVYVVGAPDYDPDYEQYPLAYRRSVERTVRDLVGSVPGATLLPGFSADCSMFMDTVHLNHKGAEQFTEYLHSRVL